MQAMQEGQTIKHDVYGLGIVTASDMERTSVDFDDHGPKLFVTSIMVAELIGEAPRHPSQDQAPPQSVDRRKSREESRRCCRSRALIQILNFSKRNTRTALRAVFFLNDAVQ